MEHGNSAHAETRVSGDGRTRKLRSSSRSRHNNQRNKNSSSSNIALRRRNKAKERYASLIRSSTKIPRTAIKQNQELRQRRRQKSFFQDECRSFFEDDLNFITESISLSILSTTKVSNMEGESLVVSDNSKPISPNEGSNASSIYRWCSTCSIGNDLQQPGKTHKDSSTTATLQTTSISTCLSGSQSSTFAPPQMTSDCAAIVSPSLSTACRSDAMIIETEVSTLTESTSFEGSNRVCKPSVFHKGTVAPGDQVLESIIRLQEIERKRSIVRDQRFGLEQRLHNFRRVAMIPESVSEEEQGEDDGSKRVINWKFKSVEHLFDGGKGRGSNRRKENEGYRGQGSGAILYTGRMDADGQPNDKDALLRFGDEQVYKGGVLNGRRHGWGTNQWPDGQIYSGEWHEDSRNGRGTHIWKDGRTVTGTWKDGHLHGKVYFRWPNGAVFDGSAKMGKKEGKGVSTRPDGTIYTGNYSNGKEDGYGTLIRPNGVKYRGEFRKGFKEGYGVMMWHTRTYDGEWSMDKPHGQGRVVWSNGAVYTGRFEEGTYSGMGVYIWPSGKKFVGRWEMGVTNGHGVHTWPSGQTYDGQYRNGIKEGYGRMTWPDGSIYCGGFKRNRRCGRGIQTDASGSLVHCGLWKHDRPCESPEHHQVAYVARPQRLRVEINNSSALKPQTEEGTELERTLEAMDESSSLPAAPAIVTPSGEDILSIDDTGFRGSDIEDRAEEEDLEEIIDEDILSEIAATFHERVSI